MKILGFNVETPRQLQARKLYYMDLVAHLERRAKEERDLEAFSAYLRGVKDGMRLEKRNHLPIYLQTALEYSKKVH